MKLGGMQADFIQQLGLTQRDGKICRDYNKKW